MTVRVAASNADIECSHKRRWQKLRDWEKKAGAVADLGIHETMGLEIFR